MADENRKTDKQLDGISSKPVKQSKKGTGTGTAEKGGNSSPEKGTGTAEGIGTGTAAGTIEGTAEEKKVSGLATLSVETDEKPKKKRVRNRVKKNDSTFNAEQITALLMTASAILTQHETTAVFAISEIEAQQLAEPISKLIAKNDSFSKLSEHADSVALVTAVFMIFAPKVFVFLQQSKQKKELKKQGLKLIKEKEKTNNDKTGTTGTDNRRTTSGATANSKADGDNIMSAIPSIM